MADKRPDEAGGTEAKGDRVVTYEAADRGAVCCLGCQAWTMILAGVAVGVWYGFSGDLWKIIVGLILIIGGIALSRYLTTGRNRWEVSFDRDRRIVALTSLVDGERQAREIPFGEIEAVELREITRDVTAGEGVLYRLPILRLLSGEEVALDERLSIKDPERAEEVLEEMRALLAEGLEEGEVISPEE